MSNSTNNYATTAGRYDNDVKLPKIEGAFFSITQNITADAERSVEFSCMFNKMLEKCI